MGRQGIGWKSMIDAVHEAKERAEYDMRMEERIQRAEEERQR